MEPAVGFEPTTDGLQNRCSTTELSWRPPGRNVTPIKKAPARFITLAGVRSRVTLSAPPIPFYSLLALELRVQVLRDAKVLLERGQGLFSKSPQFRIAQILGRFL